jgi:hypothetical protein
MEGPFARPAEPSSSWPRRGVAVEDSRHYHLVTNTRTSLPNQTSLMATSTPRPCANSEVCGSSRGRNERAYLIPTARDPGSQAENNSLLRPDKQPQSIHEHSIIRLIIRTMRVKYDDYKPAIKGLPRVSRRFSSRSVQLQLLQAQNSVPFSWRQFLRACASCTRTSSKYSSQ